MSETELDDILNGDNQTQEASAEEPKDAAAEGNTQEQKASEDATGEKAATEQQQESAEQSGDEPPSSKEEAKVPVSARDEERHRRKEAERQLQELRDKFHKQQTENQQPEEEPDWLNEPDKAASQFEHKFETRLLNERFNMSEMMARNQYGSETIDADVEKFEELVRQRPSLREELRNHTHPYDFVHQTVEKERVIEEIGDPKSYKDQLRQQLLDDPEFLEQAKKKLGVPGKSDKPSAPPSLANETSNAPRETGGPPTYRSLDDILGN